MRHQRQSGESRRQQHQLAQQDHANRVLAPLSYALTGPLARRRGDEGAAVAAFEHSMVDIPADVPAESPALGQEVDRFAHADALRAVGRIDDAERCRWSLRDGPGLPSAPFLPSIPVRRR